MTKVIALFVFGLQPGSNMFIAAPGGVFPTMDACEQRIVAVSKEMAAAKVDPQRMAYRCLEVTFAIKLASY